MSNSEAAATIDFWAGSFGEDYTKRNRVDWRQRVPFWQHILDRTMASTFLDVGCNAGWNLLALREIVGDRLEASGCDVNMAALEEAASHGFDVVNMSGAGVADYFGHGVAGLVVTSGVLIHVAPSDLKATMQAIVDVSAQYVLAVEYEATEEEEVNYRGHAGRLWKRPYSKLYQELGLSLVEHGEANGFDQCHYWLLEKTA